MKKISISLRLMPISLIAGPIAGGISAQELPASQDSGLSGTVTDTSPLDVTEMTEGPKIEGIISARSGNRMKVTTADGTDMVIVISEDTKVKASGGFLGLDRDNLAAESLLNGLPVTVKTMQWGGGLVASQIDLKNKDLKTAAMIRSGTAQGFAEQTAATEALRSRMGDIDKYNIKDTTNVYFGTGKWKLSREAQNDLCTTAAKAESMGNALLLVVGYTDTVGSEEYNQVLSEKRAGRVVNHLQQVCHWKPFRMLTPAGMAEADPLADNSTSEGRAQNRRVSVNILVSKAVDGF